MDKSHKDLLCSCQEYLVGNLVLPKLLDHMFQAKIFNQDMVDEVNKLILVPSDQRRKFIEILVMRGPNAFDTFMAGLWSSDQGFIAEHLQQQQVHLIRTDQEHPPLLV